MGNIPNAIPFTQTRIDLLKEAPIDNLLLFLSVSLMFKINFPRVAPTYVKNRGSIKIHTKNGSIDNNNVVKSPVYDKSVVETPGILYCNS